MSMEPKKLDTQGVFYGRTKKGALNLSYLLLKKRCVECGNEFC